MKKTTQADVKLSCKKSAVGPETLEQSGVIAHQMIQRVSSFKQLVNKADRANKR